MNANEELVDRIAGIKPGMSAEERFHRYDIAAQRLGRGAVILAILTLLALLVAVLVS